MKKEYILQETAVANESVPSGWRKFESETGIKSYDWFGVHWARWSDAVREAGLAPNQLQVSYQETELLDKYATLARELGRLPAKGDLRLKSRNDSEFPSDKTFDRLGAKLELVNMVLAYCRSHSGYEDVAHWCEEYAVRTRDQEPDEARPPQSEIGEVYLIKSGRFFKIGKTNAVGRRAREITLQLPARLQEFMSSKPTTLPESKRIGTADSRLSGRMANGSI